MLTSYCTSRGGELIGLRTARRVIAVVYLIGNCFTALRRITCDMGILNRYSEYPQLAPRRNACAVQYPCGSKREKLSVLSLRGSRHLPSCADINSGLALSRNHGRHGPGALPDGRAQDEFKVHEQEPKESIG
jgi:hypothetical protein